MKTKQISRITTTNVYFRYPGGGGGGGSVVCGICFLVRPYMIETVTPGLDCDMLFPFGVVLYYMTGQALPSILAYWLWWKTPTPTLL